MTKRLLAIILTVLIIGSCNSLAGSVEIKDNNSESQKVTICVNNKDTSLELSLEEAKSIRGRFLEIEKDFEGIEKINEQIQVLKELEILPSDFSADLLLSALDNYDSYRPSRGILRHFGFNIGCPLIVSHFTIGGRIKCLFYLEPYSTNQTYMYLNDPINGSYLNMTSGFLTTYVGYAFRPVYVTIIGIGIFKNPKNPIFPFFEILTPCIGFSVAFTYVDSNSRPYTLFEYNLDACLFSFIASF